MIEHFNRTLLLLNMLGTLSEHLKSDWKAHVPTFTHANNATEHESKGYSLFFLMYEQYSRLAVDAFLGLKMKKLVKRAAKSILVI